MAFLKVTMEGGSLQDLLAAQGPLLSTRVIGIALDLSRVKELTAKAISSLDDLVRAEDDDIGRIAESIRTRLDKASARSEMAGTRLDAQMDEVLERATIDAQLAKRKKRLEIE